MAKETFATLVGDPPGRLDSSWSDPLAWAGGTIPQSSDELHVQLNVSSNTANLGSQSSPFQTNDVVAAQGGLFLHIGGPNPGASGFLSVHDIDNVDDVVLANGSILSVQHDLDNVRELRFYAGGTTEIGHDLGSTAIVFQDAVPLGGTLILDNPAKGSLANQIQVNHPFFGRATESIELGHVTFDQADLLPPPPGSTTEQVQLKNHGSLVYTLTNVTGAATASFAGVDQTTGYNILQLTSA
jgi:hypothetical protein